MDWIFISFSQSAPSCLCLHFQPADLVSWTSKKQSFYSSFPLHHPRALRALYLEPHSRVQFATNLRWNFYPQPNYNFGGPFVSSQAMIIRCIPDQFSILSFLSFYKQGRKKKISLCSHVVYLIKMLIEGWGLEYPATFPYPLSHMLLRLGFSFQPKGPNQGCPWSLGTSRGYCPFCSAMTPLGSRPMWLPALRRQVPVPLEYGGENKWLNHQNRQEMATFIGHSHSSIAISQKNLLSSRWIPTASHPQNRKSLPSKPENHLPTSFSSSK